jgi:hypothetical protein
MYSGHLFTIKNTSGEDIVDRYNDIEYVFPSGETVKLPRPIGGYFLDRHRDALEVITESHGKVPEPTDRRVEVVNNGDATIAESWDDYEYIFDPGVPVEMDATVAEQIVPKHATLEIQANDPAAPEDASESAPEPSQDAPEGATSPQYSCPTCGKQYKTEKGLEKHIATKHDEGDDE